MKFNPRLFFIFASLAPLSSCNPSLETIEKVALDYGTVRFDEDEVNADSKSQMEQIDLGELNDKIQSKDNFVLLLGSNFDCGCWTTFHDEILAPYLLDHHIYLPWIPYEEGSARLGELGAELTKSGQTLMIFQNGEIAYQHTTTESNSSWAEDSKTFRSWMNARIEEPRLLTISKAQLDAKYAKSGEDFSVLFSRSSCPDCSFLEKNDIKEYFSAHIIEGGKIPDNYLYLLDCDAVGIRKVLGEDGKTYSPSSNENANAYEKQAYAQWKAFKEEYGLSYSEANLAGWDEGYVPTIFHIHPNGKDKTGSVIDYSGVFYNEEIDEGTHLIKTSYFDGARLQSEELCSLDYLKDSSLEHKNLVGLSLDASLSKHQALQVYEKPILNLLLDAIL